MSSDDRYLVIGAGFCGLGVAAALKRHGIPFEVAEADDDLGGNWYHGVYETVHIISSRKTTQYSDYPMPVDWPDFPSARQMLQYLRAYADHWQLRPHIRFNTSVEHVALLPDDRWQVTFAGGETRRYAGVVVCNGHHWSKRMPSYPGGFAGTVIHAKDYKAPAQLAGKRVLVIGGGNSACDIAVEAARFGASAHVTMRRGYWFMPKTMFGVPTVELIRPWMPLWLQRPFLKAMIRIIVGRYEQYGLQAPDHEPFEKHPTINTELLHFLRHGRITPHPDIRRFDGEAVEFVDGRREDFDLIVAATGYDLSFPFLADGVVRWRDGYPEILGMSVPDYRHLYFFGLGQPRYGAGPLISAGAELLCTMIRTQAQLEHPLGTLLQRLGQKAPRTWLQDPHAVLRHCRRSQRLMLRLPRLEPRLMGRH